MSDKKKVLLFLDTATKELEAGVLFGKEKKCLDLGSAKSALERTNLGIGELLSSCGLALKDVTDFYCLLGPGSNTGIRLGLTIPRTIYGIDPTISCFGIETLKLFLAGEKDGYAALSDRRGNLYLGVVENGNYRYEKVDKTRVKESIPSGTKVVVEKKDLEAKATLKDYPFEEIDVLERMIDKKEKFEDFSKSIDTYLPRYIQAI